MDWVLFGLGMIGAGFGLGHEVGVRRTFKWISKIRDNSTLLDDDDVADELALLDKKEYN